MKKMILGMMLVAGMAAYGAPTVDNSAKDESVGTVNLTATAQGALTMAITSIDMNFGNLRTYNGQEHPLVFTLKDDNLGGANTILTNIAYTTTNLTNTEDGNEVTVNIPENTEMEIGNVVTTVTNVVTLSQAEATVASAGTYIGSITITATYDI